MGRGDLSEIGPILLRVLAAADEQIPPLTDSLSLPIDNDGPTAKVDTWMTSKFGSSVKIYLWPSDNHTYLIKDNQITYILRIYCTFVFNVKIVNVSTPE